MKDKVFIKRNPVVSITPTIVYSELNRAYKQGYRKVSLQGSSRSGKTYNTTIWYCLFAFTHPNTKVAVVRSTMPRLKRTTYKDFEDVMQTLGIWEASRMNRSDMEYKMDNGSEICFFATEDSMAAQGLASDILFVNEATELDASVWHQLTIRCTGFIIIDYNPNFTDDHWIAKLNRDADPKELKFVKTTYKDNPYLPEQQVKEIEALKETNPRLWRIYGLGEQSLVNGLVYNEYDIVDAIPERLLHRHCFIGIDYGYKDPFAVVKVALDYSKRDLYVQELCYKSLMSMDEQVSFLLTEDCLGYQCICDNAASQFINEAKSKGVRIIAGKKASMMSRKSIMPSIAAVQSFHIHIVDGSPNLLTEIRNYTYKQDRTREDAYLDEPIDKFNHLMDAMRYVVWTKALGAGIGGGRGLIIH